MKNILRFKHIAFDTSAMRIRLRQMGEVLIQMTHTQTLNIPVSLSHQHGRIVVSANRDDECPAAPFCKCTAEPLRCVCYCGIMVYFVLGSKGAHNRPAASDLGSALTRRSSSLPSLPKLLRTQPRWRLLMQNIHSRRGKQVPQQTYEGIQNTHTLHTRATALLLDELC